MGWWSSLLAREDSEELSFERALQSGVSGEPSALVSGLTATELAQTRFFSAVFTLLGFISARDGVVCENERRFLDEVVGEMSLDSRQMRMARSLFKEGQRRSFKPESVLTPFVGQLGRRRNLVRAFLQILIEAAWSDGLIHAAENHALGAIANRLGVDDVEYSALEFMVGAAHELDVKSSGDSVKTSGRMSVKRRLSQRPPTLSARERRAALKSAQTELALSYAVLNVSHTASTGEVRRAYHRALNRYRADRLIGQGLPEEMEPTARRMSKLIRQAYRVISSAHASENRTVN